MITKVKRTTVYDRFKDTIWVADLAEMRSLSSKIRFVKYLLCVVDVFTEYAWDKTLTDKKTKTVFHGFVKRLKESKHKQNRLWVDKRGEFYNKFMIKRLNENDILMWLTHNEGKSVVTQRLIRILRKKMYVKITANDSKSYLGYLNELVLEHNNAYHCSLGKKGLC